MSDALSRINLSNLSGIGAGNKRKRVPPRDKSLLGVGSLSNEPITNELEPTAEPEADLANLMDLTSTTITPQPNIPITSKSLASQEPDLPIVKATVFRLEEDLYDTLTSWCQHHRVTRETFLEAAILAAQNDEAIKMALLNVATSRCHRRKQAKERRKARTLAAKYDY